MIEIDYTRHYRNWHSDTPEHENKMTSFYQKEILPYYPSSKDAQILDIGCGMGFLLIALQKSGYNQSKGIDIDKGQVESCNKKGLDVEQVADTIAYLNSHTSSFDFISAFDVLEHVPPKEQINFVKAVKNALKPGGQFICSVPNANSVLGNRNRYIDYTHYVTFTEISLDFVLYNSGFENIEILPMDFIRFSVNPVKLIHWLVFKTSRFFRKLTFIAELGFSQGKSIPLSFNLIGLAKK